MSTETWKAEFYPIPVEDTPPWKALDQVLLKWRGLEPAATNRHGLRWDRDELRDANGWTFRTTGSTCACCYHWGYDDTTGERCRSCPLRLAGGNSCDGWCGSQWRAWIDRQDPKPMLRLIRRAMRTLCYGRRKKQWLKRRTKGR